MEDRLQSHIERALKSLDIEPVEFALEYPADMAHGDRACNVALVASKTAGQKPRELAERIVAELGEIEGVAKIAVAGPGFINFTFARDYFVDAIATVVADPESWGKNEHGKGSTVMVEYTQPNPFKPFHIGHLMSNTIGESLARILEYAGITVVRANYQGDIGLHVAKALWGMQELSIAPDDIDGIGRAYAHAHAKYEEDEKAKAAIIELNKLGYAKKYGSPELYDKGREASLARFEELYAVLGTRFDHYFFESECEPIGIDMVEEGRAKGIFIESDDAIVFPGEQYGLHTRVFQTRYGTTTYETRELGLAELKRERVAFDRNITVTAVEQAQYFALIAQVLALLRPILEGKYLHVSHGMMQLTSGKMSSRKGNVVTGESLLDEMRQQALAKMQERDLTPDDKRAVADAVAVAAIKYMVLRQGMMKNISFDPEASLSFEGDSGPYLQYAHTRAVSILQKAAESEIATFDTATELPEDTPTAVERLLPRFPGVVARAQAEYEPHHITTYLTELAGAFNSWYAHEQIVDATDPTSPYKVALTGAFATTMKNGLYLLGVRAPKRM